MFSGEPCTLRFLPAPENTGIVLGRGSKVYLDGYDEGYMLYAATVSPSGFLSLGNGIQVTEQWGALVDAKGASAYVSAGGYVIARYDFSGPGTLGDVVPVMSAPSKIRFGATNAYAPLGYFGLVVLPL